MKKLCFRIGGKESPKGEKVYSCIDEIIPKQAQIPVSSPPYQTTDDRQSAKTKQFREATHLLTHVHSLQLDPALRPEAIPNSSAV